MEYLFGSVITLISVAVLNKILEKKIANKTIKIRRSQSYLFYILSEIAFRENDKNKKERQSDKHLNKDAVKVMIVEDKAYWIKDNQLYVADYSNGLIDNFSIQKVDTMTMDNVELERTMFIVEKLAEDK